MDSNIVSGPQKSYLTTTVFGSVWTVLQFVVTFISAIAISVILSRYLGPSKYGLLAYLSWFSTSALLVINFGILTTIQTWVPKLYFTDQQSQAAWITRQLAVAQLVIVGVGAIVLIPLAWQWHRFVSFSPSTFTTLLLLNIVPLLLNVVNAFCSTLLVSIQRFKTATIIIILGQGLALIGAVATALMHWQLFGLLIMLSIANGLLFVVYLWTARDILFQLTRSWSGLAAWSTLLKFSGWAYANILLTVVIWDKSIFFFLGKFQHGHDLAIYGIAYTLSITITGALDPLLTVFSTILAELVAKNDWPRVQLIVRLCAKYVALLLLPLVILSYVISPYIVRLAYGTSFIQVAALVPILLLASTTNKIFVTAWTIPQYKQDLQAVVPRNALVALCTIVLALVLIPRFGVWGAAAASLTTQVLATLMLSLFVRRYKLYVWTKELGGVIILNVVGGILVLLPILVHTPKSATQTSALVFFLGYIIIVWRYMIGPVDRQLVQQALATLRQRPSTSKT